MLVNIEDFNEFYEKVVSKHTRKALFYLPGNKVVTHYMRGSRLLGRKVWTREIGKDVYEEVFTNKEYGRFNYEKK